MTAKDGWTEKEHEMYDEWAEHFATYQKWLQKKPEDHQLFDMSVRNIQRRANLDYFRGFIDSISHLVAVVQNSIEKCSSEEKPEAIDTLKEYSRILLGCVEEKIKDTSVAVVETNDALPKNKEKEFYIGYRDGFEQLVRIATKMYGDQKTFATPFTVLKSIFYIQSGFCVGLMIENWPRDKVPKCKKSRNI